MLNKKTDLSRTFSSLRLVGLFSPTCTSAGETGPKTVFFWAPMMKWCLVAAGLKDMSRPADKLSASQNIGASAKHTCVFMFSYLPTSSGGNWIHLGAIFSCHHTSQLQPGCSKHHLHAIQLIFSTRHRGQLLRGLDRPEPIGPDRPVSIRGAPCNDVLTFLAVIVTPTHKLPKVSKRRCEGTRISTLDLYHACSSLTDIFISSNSPCCESHEMFFRASTSYSLRAVCLVVCESDSHPSSLDSLRQKHSAPCPTTHPLLIYDLQLP
jgi:hypothetical protein